MRHGRDLVRRWRDRGKPPLHFLHIGKTGGTAIKSVISTGGAGQYRVLPRSHRIHLPDVPVGEAVTFVVRDPVGRFVSGFNSRLRRGGVAHTREWTPGEARAFERFATPESLALALGATDEELATAARAAVEAIAHLRVHQSAWVGGLDLLRDRQADILMVGRQWALDEDFARLADLIGLRNTSLPDDPATSHRTPRGFSTGLSKEATTNVRQWYADDYALLAELARLGPSVGFAGELPADLRL